MLFLSLSEKNQCKGNFLAILFIGIHVISLANKNAIKLGRGHDVDIRITDISVSRFHSMIKYYKGNFYIEDNNSKFGTLALLKDSI